MTNLKINDIEIQVQKKKIKNIYISIKPPDGRVIVSAPKNISNDHIKELLLKKISWIKNKQEKCKSRPLPIKHDYVSGEIAYYFGKRYNLEVICSNVVSVRINDDKIILRVKEKSTIKQREKAINEWYRKNLKEEIPKLLEKWEKIIEVKSNEWRVKNMKTRWGTCNITDKRIWLNLQLAKKDIKCIEYVIVHELVHLLERNHNNIFKGYMDKFLPDWKMRKEELNKI